MTRPPAETLLAATDLVFRHGAGGTAAFDLHVPSVTLLSGALLAFIGPNGAGKSTLLSLLAGRLRPVSGTVSLLAEPLSAWPRRARARTLGYLPQTVPVDEHLTVDEVVRMGRYPHTRALGLLDAHDRAACAAAMARVQVTAFADRRLVALSGGERQRALLAAVLAQEPRVLLLDEPTAGLDLHQQTAFFRCLQDLAGAGMGVAVVTHDLNVAALFAHHLVLLHRGRVMCEGPPAQVLVPGLLAATYGAGLTVVPHPAAPDRLMVLPDLPVHGGP